MAYVSSIKLPNNSTYTVKDPEVPSWAKESTKPTYTASEVGAATSTHSHATSIASSTGTNQLTLSFGSKYTLSAGGTSYIFTMPTLPVYDGTVV